MKFFSAALALLSVASAATAAELPPITMVAMNNPELTSLVATVITVPNAAEQISGNGPFTILAPNNAAFAKLTTMPTGEAMTKVLMTHVLQGKLMSKDLKDGQTLTPLSGVPLTVSIKDGKVTINGAAVITPDLEGSNGVIHIIDSIIMPTAGAAATSTKSETPAAAATNATATNATATNATVGANSALDLGSSMMAQLFNRTLFVGAVKTANLTDTVAKGNLTLFVPSNAAITKVMAAAGNVTADAVKAILLDHAVMGTHAPMVNQTLSAASGKMNLTITSNGKGGYKVNDNPIEATLILSNGAVINLIDTVLMAKAEPAKAA